jgi:Tfp pilus assembly protein PilX
MNTQEKNTHKTDRLSDYTLLTLLYKMGNRQEQGFALVTILGLALVAMVLGATMIVKANSNRLTATNTQQTVQAEKAVQAGATQIQDFLRKNPALLTLNMDNWNNTQITATTAQLTANNQKGYTFNKPTTNASTPSAACSGVPTTPTEANATSTVTNLSSSTEGIGVTPNTTGSPTVGWRQLPALSSGEQLLYQLISYNNGRMTIAGKVGGTSGSGSESYADVNFPVNLNPTVASYMPTVNTEGIGLWVKSPASSSSSDIRTNILVTCPTTNTSFAPFDNGQTSYYSFVGTNMTMPDTPTTPSTNIKTITATSGVTLPESADITATSNPPYITKADGTREYRYIMTSITGDLTINVPERTGVSTGKYDKVTIYLTGDIDLQGGQNAIKNSRIAISNGTLSYPANSGELQLRIIGKATTGSIHLGGNAAICSAFIHAPTYNLDINGGGQAQGCYLGTGGLRMADGGTQNPNNRGVYWINSWSGGGQGNHVAHYGSGASNGDLAQYMPNALPSLGAPNAFDRIKKPGT